MKSKLKEKAVYLRTVEGLSYNEISDRLGGVSKSTLSGWLSGISLSKKHQKRLDARSAVNNNEARRKAAKTKSKLWKQKRIAQQNSGREEAGEFDLHLAGCMLYWAEGYKNRNVVGLTNTNPKMLLLFLSFLRTHYDVKNEDIRVLCHSHILSEQTLDDVEKYWIEQLGLPRECLIKGSVEERIPKRKKVKYENGICTIRVNSTEIAQRIYGSIKEYVGIEDGDLWI